MGIMPLLMSHKKVPHLWDFFDISRGCGPPHPTMPTCGSISTLQSIGVILGAVKSTNVVQSVTCVESWLSYFSIILPAESMTLQAFGSNSFLLESILHEKIIDFEIVTYE